MHWWQSPFSSPSPAKHPPQHPNDNVLTKLFPRRALRSQRRDCRAAKLRYRSADDTAPDDCRRRNRTLWRYPSANTTTSTSTNQPRSSSPSRPSPIVPPQPLPLPVLEELLRRDATTATSPSTSWSPADLPLPSPKQRPNRCQEDRDREKGGDGATPTSNNACHGCQRHEEHANTRQPVKAPQELNGIERYKDAYLFNIPNSAPSSPFSSPSRSPHRIPSHVFASPVFKSPKVFQAWSAPEMRPLDTHLGSAFSYQMSPEGKSAYSVESSPLHSPRVSPQRYPRSPGGSTSPSVHRLPLPPGATSPTMIPNVSPIIMPIKSQWQKGKLIGRGTFGSVYVASNRETGALCAMKEVELFFDDAKSAESIKQLEQEIKVLSNLQHPNIVQYYGSEVDGDRLYIYLEYVHPGSINKYIHDHCGVMSESVVRSFTRHILCGLAYLHSTRTIHRDIKCANLLVDVSGVVKLADFGMAKHLAGPAAANLSLKGSPYWMAPELLQSVMQKDASSDLALAVDIWSLGCTIIEMLNGKPPWSEYEGAAAMFKVLRETPPVPEILSAEGKDFLHCCFRRNPADRPSAIKLLEHRFLSTSQMDVLPCTQVFNGMSLMDKAESSREPRTYELEPLLQSQDIHTRRGGIVAKRSTFETLPGLSPHLG